VKATEVTAGLAESNGSLLPGLWRDSLHWLPVHRDQLRAQRSVTSMGKLYLFYSTENRSFGDVVPSQSLGSVTTTVWKETTKSNSSDCAGECGNVKQTSGARHCGRTGVDTGHEHVLNHIVVWPTMNCSLIGWNAVTWRRALSHVHRFMVTRCDI